MKNEFYVTTREIEHPEREHSYRLPQGEPLPEDQRLKTQRPTGNFRFGQFLSDETLVALASIK